MRPFKDERKDYRKQEIACCFTCAKAIHGYEGDLFCKLFIDHVREDYRGLRLKKYVYGYADYLGWCDKYRRAKE